MKIDVTTNSGMPMYGLDSITPEVFDRLDRLGRGVVVCINGDLKNAYTVSWCDKGCNDDGVYYKACVGRLADSDYCGHYDAVWFNRNTFRQSVGDFIKRGGNYILPETFARMRWGLVA